MSAAFDPQEIVQRSQSYEGFMPMVGSARQLGYANYFGFKHISIKSAFGPITTPLKWVLADAASKVSMTVLNITPIQSQEIQDYAKTRILTRRFWFSRYQAVDGATTIPPSVVSMK